MILNWPDGLAESEKQLYVAAFQRCQEIINTKSNDIIVSEIVDEVVKLWGPIVKDADMLKKFLLTEVKVPIDPVVVIADPAVKEKDWFTKLKTGDAQRLEYWDRYKNYLYMKPSWSWDAVLDIDNSTDAVLNFMADPRLKIKQNIYGLAFGYVQSGKTAHYMGVINKAADVGYKIIIVLSGIHNNLRSQTQIRLEEEFLGYNVSGIDGVTENAIGVGLKSKVKNHIQALTSREENGDFSKFKAGTSMNPPFLIVTKKNASVLKNLKKYFEALPILKKDENGKMILPAEYTVLIIDDEADQASLNTRDCFNDDGTYIEDFNPTTINKRIRELLGLFESYSFVGYTATPFANVFIPPKVEDKRYGKDLFPKDFIINIPRPDNYIGALEYFGLTEDDDSIQAMPLFRPIIKGKDYLGKGTKKDDIVGALPDELKTAIKSFLISVAVRNLRGQKNQPNTMLIHIVRFKGQQNSIKKKVEKYFKEEIVNYIKNNDSEIEEDLKKIWESDYVPTTEKMRNDFSKYMDGVVGLNWEPVYKEIIRFVKSREYNIYSINGDSDDTLMYSQHKGEPFNVIVIGGDKLSRGLTLEGLDVSYFTRSANTYDTLMQMGRWFGYRPGYLDLCRLYTTKALNGYFVDVSRATEDLVRQVNYMSNDVKQTPMQFGLGVETCPDLLITSKNKMRTGKDMKRDFSCKLTQTRVLDVDADEFNENFDAVETLLNSIGKPASSDEISKKTYHNKSSYYFWFDVNGRYVADFLEQYKTSDSASRANSKYMSDYIKNQMKVDGLNAWTICLINISAEGRQPFDIAQLKGVGAGITRKDLTYTDGDSTCDIHTLLSKDHEYLDYQSDEEFKKLQSEGVEAEEIRKQTRQREKGLLLLYPIGNVRPLTEEMDRTGSKTPFGIAVVFPDRQGLGNIKSYHINDIAVEKKSYDFDT